MYGTYRIVGFSGVKDYDMTASGGGVGKYAKIMLRVPDEVEAVEVKAEPVEKWATLVDKEVEIFFKLRKGSVIVAQFPVK